MKNKYFLGLTCISLVISLMFASCEKLIGDNNDETPKDTTPPKEVTAITATAGDSKVTLQWTDPTDIDFEKVEINFSPQKNGVEQPITIYAREEKAIITGLTNGTKYTFRVKTVDVTGNMSSGKTKNATPASDSVDNPGDDSSDDPSDEPVDEAPVDPTAPEEVMDLIVTAGDGSITFTWTVPTDGDSKRVQVDDYSSGSTSIPMKRGFFVLLGLSNGTTYTYKVKSAYSATGTTSAGVTVTVTPLAELISEVITTDEPIIPQWVVDFVREERNSILSSPYWPTSDVRFQFFYNASGDAVVTYDVKRNGTWEKFGQLTNRLSTMYSGDEFYWPTIRQQDLNKLAWLDRMEDPAFKSIEAVVYQIGLDFDYDWNNYAGNTYGVVTYENPTTTKAVCSGFTSETTTRLLANEYVDYIERWTGGNHAWNVIILKDGRRLYCDSTWYEGNRVRNGVVPYGCAQEVSQLTFDADEFNSFGYSTAPDGGYLKIHCDWPGATFIEYRR
ncbi:hypothetical protein AGMMS4952_24840 [Spirochaetia bacterium]|nr:hypothetical protein AGMMS4952_24840 [Spirochaetia bacterium]